MFGTLRNKFQTVQEGISASIRGLAVTESTRPKKSVNVRKVNYNAGADLLYHFQVQWNELHELTEENAVKAQEADALIATIHDRLEKEWINVSKLNSVLAAVPKLNNEIQNLMDQIGSLQEMFEEVEGAIYRLEDLNETLELQSMQLDHRFQLAMYKENKLAELDSVRAKLAEEHSERILKHELKQQQTLRERRETFEEAFNQEIEQYKATGSVPKVSTPQHGLSLDEVELDAADSAELDEFLQS